MSLPTLNWPQSQGFSSESLFLVTYYWSKMGWTLASGQHLPKVFSNLKDALEELPDLLNDARLTSRLEDYVLDDPEAYQHLFFNGQNFLTLLDEGFYDSFALIIHNTKFANELKAITEEIFSSTTVSISDYASRLMISSPIPTNLDEKVVDLENQIKRKYEGTTSLIKIFLEDRDEDYPAVEFIEVWYLRGD